MIFLTTSRKPSNRTRSFCRDLEANLPIFYKNRGKYNVAEMVEFARQAGCDRLWIVGETKGNPSIIRVISTAPPWRWLLQFYIRNVSLSRERGIKEKAEAETWTISADHADFWERVMGKKPEGVEEIALEERNWEVRFVWNGKEVGPRFKIIGMDPVPKSLSRLR